jgi:hypothetical protein
VSLANSAGGRDRLTGLPVVQARAVRMSRTTLMNEDDDQPDRRHDLAWWMLWAAIAILAVVGLNSVLRAATSEPVKAAAASSGPAYTARL